MLGTKCESSNGDNAGCSFVQDSDNTFGHLFNMQAGGVFAHTLEDDAVSVWFFDRHAIPQDIKDKRPDPSSWGTPTAFFPNTQCDIMGHFLPQSLIFDITICGDWAGPAYESSGCPGTCSQAVAESKNYDCACLSSPYSSFRRGSCSSPSFSQPICDVSAACRLLPVLRSVLLVSR